MGRLVSAPNTGHPAFLATGLVEHMREGGDPFLWDLVDALDGLPGRLDHPQAARQAEYLTALADALAVRLGKRPEAYTPAGEP